MDPMHVAPMIMMVVLSLSAAGVLIFRGPLGKALARRIEGSHAADPDLLHRVEELEARLQSVELAEGRLAEIEERLDFAERLLARETRKAPQVESGGA